VKQRKCDQDFKFSNQLKTNLDEFMEFFISRPLKDIKNSKHAFRTTGRFEDFSHDWIILKLED
jgi:hypothetical protein